MLICAITAFVVFPGMVAFAIPVWIGYAAPLRHPLLAAPFLILRVLLFEEPWAARTFGEQWQAYRARVRRWVV